MAQKRVARVQDCVHGLMEFRGTEAVVIELLRTPELQRLRKIRQLGMANLVFPGAEHSRLVHSLGAAHLAIRFGRHLADISRMLFVPELCPDENAIKDLAVAALCHDLGHGPLSHAWERELVGEGYDHNAWRATLGVDDSFLPSRPKWHELVTNALLAWKDGHLHKLLEHHERGSSLRIRQLLSGDYYFPYWPRLLNGDVDVDRADYIVRDTYQTGVAYGRYDLNWLISTATLGKQQFGDKYRWVIGFDNRKAVRVIEQFLIARRALYETVYHHKTVRCAEGMMSLFLRRLRQIAQQGLLLSVPTFVEPLKKILKGEVIGPDELLQLDDFAVNVLVDLVATSDIKDETAKDLARRIRARDLFKHIPFKPNEVREYLTKPHAHDQLFEAIKRFCPGESQFYLVQDHLKFDMMVTKDTETVCLVDEGGTVSCCRDDQAFEGLRQYSRDEIRFFTVREAIPTVIDVVRAGR